MVVGIIARAALIVVTPPSVTSTPLHSNDNTNNKSGQLNLGVYELGASSVPRSSSIGRRWSEGGRATTMERLGIGSICRSSTRSPFRHPVAR